MNKISCINVSKTFFIENNSIKVLDNINLSIQKGELVAISGQSGAGKSTLLHIMASLDSASSGKIIYDDNPIENNTNATLSNIRLNNFGFVYQFHYLLEDLTIFENCDLTFQILQSKDRAANHQSILAIFDELGISHLKDHYPFMLSGGERQRAAIARAVAHKPTFLLMDEPTGNLDNENAAIIQELTINLSKKLNMGIIVATHDLDYAKQLDDVYKIENTKLHRVDNE